MKTINVITNNPIYDEINDYKLRTYSADEAELKSNLCFNELERLLRFDILDVKERLEIVSKRSFAEYLLTEKLIDYNKHLIKFCNKNNTDDLYLLYSKDLDLYKIGITCNLEQRIKNIKYEMGIKELDVIYLLPKMAHKEKELHEKFKKKNVIVKRKLNHREWFSYDKKIINTFEKLKNE